VLLIGLAFYGITADCFAQLRYDPSELSSAEKVDELYRYVTGMWPADPIWSQMRVAMTNIADGNDTAAQAAVDKLLSDFSANQHLPVALHEIAKLYGWLKKYDKAGKLQQRIISNWPTHEYAMWSLRDVARQNIEQGNVQAAQAAMDKVIADFSSNKYAALIAYEVAEHYRKFEQYEKAKQLYQYAVDTWPDALDTSPGNWWVVLSQSGLARLYIDEGKETAAQAAVDKLFADFSSNGTIGRAVYEIAKHYRLLGKYDKAKPLYEYVVDNCPGDYHEMWSQSGLAQCHIGLGEMQAAQTAADILIANYQLTLRIEEGVYDIAYQYQTSGQYEEAKQLYQYVLDTWPDCKDVAWVQAGLAAANIGLGDKIAAEALVDKFVAELGADFPSGSKLSNKGAEGYYYAGNSYRELNRYEKSIQCYERITDDCPDYEYTWSALFRTGRNYEELKKSGTISASEANPKIRIVYEQLLEKYPKCPAAKDTGRWLSQRSSN